MLPRCAVDSVSFLMTPSAIRLFTTVCMLSLRGSTRRHRRARTYGAAIASAIAPSSVAARTTMLVFPRMNPPTPNATTIGAMITRATIARRPFCSSSCTAAPRGASLRPAAWNDNRPSLSTDAHRNDQAVEASESWSSSIGSPATTVRPGLGVHGLGAFTRSQRCEEENASQLAPGKSAELEIIIWMPCRWGRIRPRAEGFCSRARASSWQPGKGSRHLLGKGQVS